MALEQIKEKARGERTLSCRSEMKISGVEEVESFDEESAATTGLYVRDGYTLMDRLVK